MKLNSLKNDSSPRKSRKRVGRGIGSGTGKTCGRGHKGQKSRSGSSVNGFEGGQMPIYRRVPKRGFVNIFRKTFNTINICDLQRYSEAKKIDASKPVNIDSLVEAGIFKNANRPLKILAKGELKVALKIEASAASESAIKAVEKAGGKLTVKSAESKKAA